jgi:F-type H+-transporting ATPase subunit b
MLLLNSLMDPSLGIIFWTTLVFVILWFFLAKFAWKPIASALKEREQGIANALSEAEEAREEMASLKAGHEEILIEANEEKANILREAKEIKESIINDAKDKAKAEATKILEMAKDEIHNEKMAAITDVKNLIGSSAVSLASQVLSRELNDKNAQQSFIEQELKRIKLN